MEFKDIDIGEYTFRIRKNRSFKKKCELDIKLIKREPITAMDFVRADAKLKILRRDEKGKVIGDDFVDVDDYTLDKMDDKEGRELLQKVIEYRGPDADFQIGENTIKKEPEALSGESKTTSEEKAITPQS